MSFESDLNKTASTEEHDYYTVKKLDHIQILLAYIRYDQILAAKQEPTKIHYLHTEGHRHYQSVLPCISSVLSNIYLKKDQKWHYSDSTGIHKIGPNPCHRANYIRLLFALWWTQPQPECLAMSIKNASKKWRIRPVKSYDLIQILLAHIRYDENPCRKARTSTFVICTLKSTSTTVVFCYVNRKCIPLLSYTQITDAIIEHTWSYIDSTGAHKVWSNLCRKARIYVFTICTLQGTSTTKMSCHVNQECFRMFFL